MLKSIKSYFANRSIKKLERTFKSPKQVSLNDVKTVGVLVNFEDFQNLPEEKVRKQLNTILDAPLTFITYCDNKKNYEQFGGQKGNLVLGKPDLSFDLSPSDNTSYDFDLIIDFRSGENQPLQFILLKSNCQMRMGLQRDWNKTFLDFMIQVPNSIDFYEASRELTKYWEMVNKH